MKKRLLSLLLAGVMVLSLAACGSKDNNGEANNGEVEEGGLSGEITFVAWGSDAEIECDEKAVAKFMELHPGTTVHFEALNDSYGTTVETRFLGGESPDVIYGHPQTLLTWIQEGMLMPITDVYEENEELWDEDVFFTNLYESYKYDGEYYAIPVGADTSVLFYNKGLFEENNIPLPTAETTWEELADAAKKLTKRDENGIPTVVGTDSVTGWWQYILYSYDGKVVDDMNNPTEVVFESEAALKTLQWINDNWKEEGGFSPSDNDWSYLANGFAGGEMGMFISGVYDIVWLSGVEGVEWDIAPIPGTMENEGDTPVLYCGYAVSSQTENEALAKEFAKFMASYDAQVIMSETGLITSLRKDVAYSDEALKTPGAPENHSLRVDNLPYAQNIQGQCLCWWEMTDVINNTIYQMVHGELTPEQAMSQIQTECEALLAAELAQ